MIVPDNSSRHPLTDSFVTSVEDFKRGAILAAFPHDAEKVEGLTPEELTALREEKTNKWKQPWQVYYIAIISSMAAVVQGMECVVLRLCQFFSAQTSSPQ